MRSIRFNVLCVAAGLAGVMFAAGCGSKSSPETAAPAPSPTAAAEKPAPAAPAPSAPVAQAATSAIDDPSFSLHLVPAGPYKVGELGRVVVQLEPHGVFHVNQEYPIEIALSGDADTAFPKAKLERADAAEFGEKKAKFEAPFTAKVAGEHKLLANVKFAVCTPENCVPDERNLVLAVAVN